MIGIPRGNQKEQKRGTWWWQKRDDKLIPMLKCPCGQPASLDSHEIDKENGVVTPSAACPNNCGWWENVQLMGFE